MPEDAGDQDIDPTVAAQWMQRAVRISMPVFFAILLLLPFLPSLGVQLFPSFDVFERLVVASLLASASGNVIFFSVLIRGKINREKSMLFSAVLTFFTTVLAMVLLLRPEIASRITFHLTFAIALHLCYLWIDLSIAGERRAGPAIREDFRETVRNIDIPTLIGLVGSAALALIVVFRQDHVEVERFVAGATTFQVIFNWVASGLAQDPAWMGSPAPAQA